MKDPGDKLTPELPELSAEEKVYQAFCVGLTGFIERGMAAQRAVDELGAGKPRRVRKGGASKSAARSADKPERSAK